MIRLLIRTAIFLGSAALGLIAASLILDDFSISASGFIFVVVIYALIQSIISPFLMKVAAKNATAFLGGIGLVATFVALLVVTLIGDSLTIKGASTWILATLIVWLVTALASFLLPMFLIKNAVEARRD
ncbi:phage holin family protein [Nocardioides sp.]|uniref:phage holin family protein n=1 Tax=Nocardioides sp. TaxID=35761 RepID=UPI003D0F1BE1